jgi:glucuronoarabinoxylan endo-1,4-beta-xylanase
LSHLQNDATAVKNFAIVGGHIYGGGLANYTLAKQKGKEVWMTEHYNDGNTWASMMQTAKEIHDAMTVADYNAYILWSVIPLG